MILFAQVDAVALILVVDDEPLIRMATTEMLEDAGHRVLEAADADEAVRILENFDNIEVVFSDVNMPGSMDGLRLMHVIRTRWPPIKLILASGKTIVDASLLPAGSTFLSKPFTPVMVMEALAVWSL